MRRSLTGLEGNESIERNISSQLCLSWANLGYRVENERAARWLVKDMNGIVGSSESLAILGPSGAGKTTLMNLIADRMDGRGTQEGAVFINGRPRTENFRLQATYVNQECEFLETFTVLESLQFAANLTMERGTSRFDRNSKISEFVNVFGLDPCVNTLVGNISGGQRKRLSVAVALFSDTPIVFLDEPTTKLDSAAAYQVFEVIRQLTQRGKIVVFTIHQPSSEIFTMFDKLLLIGRGKQAFFGKASSAIDYFSQLGRKCPAYSNPADFFLSLLNEDFQSNEICDEILSHYNYSAEKVELSQKILASIGDRDFPEPEHPKRASFVEQLIWVAKRNAWNTNLNPKVMKTRVFFYTTYALSVGYLFSERSRKNIPSSSILAFFFTILYNFSLQNMSALPFFLNLRPVFIRERSNGIYDVLPFHLANFFCTIPVLLVASFSMTLIFHFWMDLYGNYFWFWATSFSLMLCSESLMHVLSAVTKHYVIGLCLANLYVIFFGFQCGYIVPKSQLTSLSKINYYSSFLSYAFQNFVFIEFEADPDGQKILDDYGFVDTGVQTNLLVINVFTLLFQLTFFLLLYYVHTGKNKVGRLL